MMTTSAFLLVMLVYSVSALQQCAQLRGTPLEGCIKAGYNSTYPIPESFKLSSSAESRIRGYISYSLKYMENCSLAKMGEAVFCSEFAPYCREKDSSPFLPCRRVCSEYLKRCEGTMDQYWLEFGIGSCTLLPNLTAASGKCYEPPGFDYYHNASTKGLLEGDCVPFFFPMCDSVGYKHTIISMVTQQRLYRLAYGKNYTNTSADSNPSPKSFMQQIHKLFDSHPKCSALLKQLFCADNFPPCFPGEGLALYTLCRPLCQQIALQCPELLKTSYIRFIIDCDIRTAPGNSTHGFCKQTKWPPPVRWLRWFKDIQAPSPAPGPPTSQPAPTVKMYVIVIAVIVPIILIALIILAVVAWRQHKLPTICLRGQDKDDLVSPSP